MADLMDKTFFRQILIDRQITTQFFNPRERQEIGCIIEMLDNAPAVDAVEVIRCKYCKHRRDSLCANPFGGMWVGVELKDNDFCSFGQGLV